MIDYATATIKAEVVNQVKQEWNKITQTPPDFTSLAYGGGYVSMEVAIGILTAGIATEAKAALYSLEAVQKTVQIVAKVGRVSKSALTSLAKVIRSGNAYVTKAGLLVVKNLQQVADALPLPAEVYDVLSQPNGQPVLRWRIVFMTGENRLGYFPHPFDGYANLIRLKSANQLDALRNAFEADFNNASSSVLKELNALSNLGDVYEVLYQAGKTEWRKDLAVLKDLSEDLAKARNNDLKKFLQANPAQVDVWRDIRLNPDKYWDIAKSNPLDPVVQKWGQIEFFKVVTGYGKEFEEKVVLSALRDINNSWYQLLKRRAGVNLDEYELFSQVQLKYNNEDFFVADQLFIKFKLINNVRVIDDVIVIENKLSKLTQLTENQSNAKGINTYVVRSVNKPGLKNHSIILNKSNPSPEENTISTVSALTIKWYKIYNGGKGAAITDIDPLP